ncbi:MAG: hypothetical protein M1299_10260 [Firmicutes bacterium]|nr:hypothetical protein [Bacillota bacterium]MCL5040187.1 hypothetical protein [Bacillota bacterium]
MQNLFLTVAGVLMFLLFFGWADFIGPFWLHDKLALAVNALQLVVILGAMFYIVYLIKQGIT